LLTNLCTDGKEVPLEQVTSTPSSVTVSSNVPVKLIPVSGQISLHRVLVSHTGDLVSIENFFLFKTIMRMVTLVCRMM